MKKASIAIVLRLALILVVHRGRGFVPTWAKWLGGIGSICITAVLVSYILLSNSTNSNSTNGNNLEPPSHVPVLLTAEQEDMPIPQPTIHSKYVSGKTPTIDGVLQAGEWTEPAFTKPFLYSIDGKEKSGDMAGYFMNDDEFLYAAIAVNAEDFKEDYMDYHVRTYFYLGLYFDGDNDNIIALGEDCKSFWRDDYRDEHLIISGTSFYENQHGNGSATCSSEDNVIMYEMMIPLDSGDAYDISADVGDTIGLLISLRQSYEVRSEDRFVTYLGSIGWPIESSFSDAIIYGKLVLGI